MATRDANETNVRELVLYTENDGELYQGLIQHGQKNLLRKMNAGTYDHELAKKYWKQVMDIAAKKYGEEFGNGDGFKIFSPDDRRAAAEEMADGFKAAVDAGDYSNLADELKTQKQKKGLGGLGASKAKNDHNYYKNIVTHPGKFEGELAYVPYFWEEFLNGGADDDDGVTLTFDVTKEDRKMFPELTGTLHVYLAERDDGFVVEVDEPVDDGEESDEGSP